MSCHNKNSKGKPGEKITCRAALVREFNKPFTIETIEVEPPGEKEVRVKIVAAGLCHSDLHMLEGVMPMQKLPYVAGHEGAGIVESVGPGVTTVKPGDQVLTMCIPQCRECKSCKDGRNNVCEDSGRKEVRGPTEAFLRCTGYDGKVKFFSKGEPVYHFAGTSCFSEYTVVPENSCVKIDPKAPLDKVVLCACGIPTGYGASTISVNMKPGDKCAIWGVGGVGLATVVGCKHKGAGQIIGIAMSNNKEALAKKMGCTDFIASKTLTKSVPEAVQEISKGGVDFAFVAVGDVKAMEDAVMSTRQGGTTIILGMPDEVTSLLKIPAILLLLKRSIAGSMLGDFKVRDDIPALVTSYMKGKLPLDEFITNRFKLEEVNEGYALMKAGKGLRSVLIM